ncbi:MAG: class I SAM-dependent methyltransferase [Candidatus Hodarchaeota archaeon]
MERFKKKPDKKKKIIRDYNSTSLFYDKRYEEIQKEKYDLILKDFKLKDKILIDAGCGTGLLFEFLDLIKVQNECSYIGTDISWKMLKVFHVKLKRLTTKININLILSDIEYLPLRSNIFDSIFSITTFQNLKNVNLGLKELIRSAKNGAEFKLSILKKNLNLKKLLKVIKSFIQDLEIKSFEKLEDVIIQGFVLKK